MCLKPYGGLTRTRQTSSFRDVQTTPDLIYTAQAALILEVSPRTVARLVERKRLAPAVPAHGNAALVFHRADVEALRDELAAAS